MATAAITNDQDVVTAEVFIAAPPTRVFQALTDPAQMSRWWGQSGVYRITETQADLRVGGKWFSVGEAADGTSFRIDGEYLELDPPRLVVQTWLASWTGPIRTVVRWELEPQSVHDLHPNGPQRAGTGTLVKIRHEGFAASSTAAGSAQGHAEGWKRVLGWLTNYVEKGETLDTRG